MCAWVSLEKCLIFLQIFFSLQVWYSYCAVKLHINIYMLAHIVMWCDVVCLCWCISISEEPAVSIMRLGDIPALTEAAVSFEMFAHIHQYTWQKFRKTRGFVFTALRTPYILRYFGVLQAVICFVLGGNVNLCNCIFIVAPCILKIHWILHTNKCTDCI